MRNGLEDRYIKKGKDKLKLGYTTGSCAAAAAKASCEMLFSGERVAEVRLITPKGIKLYLTPEEIRHDKESVTCAIKKYAGDDPDATDGMLVFATCRKISKERASELRRIFGDEDGTVGITAGNGVGTVTLPGLEQPIGAPAVNVMPRKMITESVMEICDRYGYKDGIEVILSIPGGEKTTEKTFNPRLGIKGGLSILGTSGIVEPMSEAALIKSIEIEMKQKSAGGQRNLIITPGNYGTRYLSDNFPFDDSKAVKCSNYVGQTIDMAVNMELDGLIFVAHIGKFVKLAGGIMNTHSRDADCRMEILSSAAIRSGADAATAMDILKCVTTDDALKVIEESGCIDKTMEYIVDRISYYMNHRSSGAIKTEAVIFSNSFGELGRTAGANELLELMKEYEKNNDN